MFSHLKKGVPLAVTLQFQIENVLIKGLSLFNVVYLNSDVIHSINVYTHNSFLGSLREQSASLPTKNIRRAATRRQLLLP